MANWPTTPTWIPVANINQGSKYETSDGVTVNDLNNIINNMLYLKKYGGRVNVLKIDAKVSDHKLVLKAEEV